MARAQTRSKPKSGGAGRLGSRVVPADDAKEILSTFLSVYALHVVA